MNKKYSLAVLALGSLALGATVSSCEDFLDQTSESELTTETVFNSVYYTGLRINKTYGLLGQDQTYSQVIPIVAGLNTDIELVDGLGASNSTANSERGVMNYNATPQMWEKGLKRVWEGLFGIIEDCNLNIEGIRASSLTNGGGSEQTQMRRYLGETLTLRAMCYLDLIRLYGDVPLKLESSKSDLSNVYNSKADRDVILDSLLLNLEEAIELLPWAYDASDYTTERITRGYACALYAQVALTRAGYAIRESAKAGYVTATENSDPTYPTQRPDDATRKSLYEKALVKLTAIINSGKHSLNPSFEDEWYQVNQRTLDAVYKENIFEIPMGLSVTGELGYTVGVRINGASTQYGPKGNSSGKLKITCMHLYSYDPADTRRDITCANYELKEEDGVLKEKTIDNKPFEIYCAKWDIRKMNEAWRQAALASTEKVMTGINVIRMRYSQVLLLYAETLNELAGPDAGYAGYAGITARQAVAMVHTRAFDQADKSSAEAWVAALPSDKDGFLDKGIAQEHAWELAGEGIRKFDLIRWNKLVSKIQESKEIFQNDITDVVPETIYFNYSDAAKTKIDLKSIQWYAIPANASEYDASFKGFGAGDSKDYLQYISAGLTTPVMNRYLMPIYESTISDSNGTLTNSYGWGN